MIRLKEIRMTGTLPMIAFLDSETDEIWVTDRKTMYRYFHNQIVTSISYVNGKDYDRLIIGNISDNVRIGG